MNTANHLNEVAGTQQQPAMEPPKSSTDLKPKGACWYCNQPLDNVRRFCSKACADDYRTEEEVFRSV